MLNFSVITFASGHWSFALVRGWPLLFVAVRLLMVLMASLSIVYVAVDLLLFLLVLLHKFGFCHDSFNLVGLRIDRVTLCPHSSL